ncbi:MAG: hypothetical protein ACT6SF_16575 [Hydrogenophaga sp.]|uniref:hypothetical protein n=1 Tax=Hydrogenophaga sp. TaxID=1904254 RepID=UPI00403571BE
MTLRELAHLAQQTLQTHAGGPVKRSHVHELLAAAFGHRSWAAFRATAVLADAGVGEGPSDASPQVLGRAVQLGYHQQAAVGIARAFLVFIAEHQLSCVSWSVLAAGLAPPVVAEGDDQDDDYEEFEEVRSAAPVQPTGPALEQLTRSPLLKSSVEAAAESANPHAHFLLAALYRCRTPNPYLYEESLKGRVLNAAERGWVEDYLRLEPQHRKYEAHLKAAALGGVRAAALEYGTHFESRDFIELAERLTGDVDASMMARAATTPEARASWLRVAAERGVRSALEELAHQGDAWAEERFAEHGDIHWLRLAAERAVEVGDAMRAWTWQYLALEHRVDLTRSTMAAYHDGGQQDGQFYDSDFGGAMYVDGNEGLALPALSRADHRTAKAEAKLIFRKFS